MYKIPFEKKKSKQLVKHFAKKGLHRNTSKVGIYILKIKYYTHYSIH